jgi:type 1 glutamine amidotransferase
MLITTQVAPYADGPAGVHGVLGQATTALVQLAESAGLDPVVVADVRDLSPHQLASAKVLALFTIGETPFTIEQKTALFDGWRRGQVGILGIHSATDACHNWTEYGALVGARFDGHPWTQDFIISPGYRAPRRALAMARRDLLVLRPASRCPGIAPVGG